MRERVEQALGAEVFIDVWPEHPLAGPDQPPVCSLRWSCLRQSPRPCQWDANDATVGKLCYDFVVGYLHVLDDRFGANHNVHAMPPESRFDASGSFVESHSIGMNTTLE